MLASISLLDPSRRLLLVSATVGLTACTDVAEGPSPIREDGVPLEAFSTWSHYLGDPGRSHYSTLSQIDTTNVAGLQVRWVHQMAELGRAGTTPLVVDGVMYITEPPSSVIALDAGTGRPYWRYDHPPPDELS